MSLPVDQIKSGGWTLFLDRDGVINKHLPGRYVESWDMWAYTERALDALVALSGLFHTMVVVTNQQGVAKGLMDLNDLHAIHDRFKNDLSDAGGRIDGIYSCTESSLDVPNCRKPSPAMALWARQEHPSIDFSRSVMIGDNITDLQFGRQLEMATVFVSTGESARIDVGSLADVSVYSLWEFCQMLT